MTQRRARADLSLSAQGADADRWLDLAQAVPGRPARDAPREVVRNQGVDKGAGAECHQPHG